VCTTDAWPYLGANLAGAPILAALAWLDGQWGFFLLESVWTLVTAGSIAAKLRGTDAPTRAS
jgi:hypothetical protein